MRHSRMSLRFVVTAMALAVACMSLAPAPASAGPRGNSDAAKACQKGGYKSLFREDGTGFANTGECVSYAAKGGKFQAPVVSVLEWIVTPNGSNFNLVLHGEGLMFPSNVDVSITIDDGVINETVPVLADGTAGSFADQILCGDLPLHQFFRADAITPSGDTIIAMINDTEVCPPFEGF